MSVNTNSFAVQCSVIASAALTRDRVLHLLSRKKKFYSPNFHVIDIKHLFQCNRLLYYLKECFFTYNRWAGQKYQYLKDSGDNPIANKKITLGQVVTNFTGKNIINRVCVKKIFGDFSNIFDREKFSAERCAFSYCSALD